MYIHIIILFYAGVQQNIQLPVNTAITTNTQALLSSDQQGHSMLASKQIHSIRVTKLYSNRLAPW